jgi:uncharacterized protein YjbJ (UPF0337 family)
VQARAVSHRAGKHGKPQEKADMNKDIWNGRWMQVKGTIQENWGKLTDDELEEAKGDAKQLSGLLQERYGMAREQAEKEIETLRKAA